MKRIVHPSYKEGCFYDDIALFLQFNQYIRPLCLHTGQSFDQGKVIATGWGGLEFGDSCCAGEGVCKVLRNCLPALENIKLGQRPMICSFRGFDTVVCCIEKSAPKKTPAQTSGLNHTHNINRKPFYPTIQQPLKQPQSSDDISTMTLQKPSVDFGEKSRQMCREYAKSVKKKEESLVSLPGFPTEIIEVDQCGRVEEPLIVNGEAANPREFPHMVLIGFYKEQNYKLRCGGSLISESYVLSAAHCSKVNGKPALWARLGDLILDSNSDEAEPVTIRITKRIVHPRYKEGRFYDDIALFLLERPVQFNQYIRPLCLHTGQSFDQGKVIATGWGGLEFGGRLSKELRKVKFGIIPFSECSKTYRPRLGSSLPRGILTDSQLCAGGEGKDTCQGDSGGPLQVPVKDPYCMYLLIGITSFGSGCGSNPGIYTKISHYVPWIESIVWP